MYGESPYYVQRKFKHFLQLLSMKLIVNLTVNNFTIKGTKTVIRIVWIVGMNPEFSYRMF